MNQFDLIVLFRQFQLERHEGPNLREEQMYVRHIIVSSPHRATPLGRQGEYELEAHLPREEGRHILVAAAAADH